MWFRASKAVAIPENLVVASFSANSQKGELSVEQFCDKAGLDFITVNQRLSKALRKPIEGYLGSLKDKDKEKEEDILGLEVQEEGGIPPITLETAKANAGQHGATPEIAEKWWLDQDARGWLDGRGQPIVKPWSHLRSYAINWRANDAKARPASRSGQPSPSGPPPSDPFAVKGRVLTLADMRAKSQKP